MVTEYKSLIILKYSALVLLSYIISLYFNYFIFNSSHVIISIFLSLIIFVCIYKLFFQSIDYINIENKAVLITGCDSGIGYNTAIGLNEKGFRVYATVLDESTELIKNSRFKDQMIVMKMDVTDDDDIKNVYKYISNDINEKSYVLWSVVNNAGVSEYCPFDWGSFESCFNIINVNLLGTIRVTRAFIPLIHKSKGRIVNVSSAASRISSENMTYYNSSKNSVSAFTNCLRLEMKKFGIKVSTIEPGAFKTPGQDREKLIKAINTNWYNTDNEVRNIYGKAAHPIFVRNFIKSHDNVVQSSNLDIVSNDIIDAIINVNPKIMYRPNDKLRIFSILCY